MILRCYKCSVRTAWLPHYMLLLAMEKFVRIFSQLSRFPYVLEHRKRLRSSHNLVVVDL
jgi:hypothetical protein